MTHGYADCSQCKMIIDRKQSLSVVQQTFCFPRSSQSPRQLFYTFSSIFKLPTFLLSSSLSADPIAFFFLWKNTEMENKFLILPCLPPYPHHFLYICPPLVRRSSFVHLDPLIPAPCFIFPHSTSHQLVCCMFRRQTPWRHKLCLFSFIASEMHSRWLIIFIEKSNEMLY